MMFRRVAVKKRLFGIVIASLCGFTILQTRNHAIKALFNAPSPGLWLCSMVLEIMED